jgi:hypothetical protein
MPERNLVTTRKGQMLHTANCGHTKGSATPWPQADNLTDATIHAYILDNAIDTCRHCKPLVSDD